MIDVESITNQIINADCMDILKQLPDKCIDLVVTSPPYDNLRTYNGTLEWNFEIFQNIAKELARVLKDGGVIVWIVADATINGSETGTSFRQALYFKELGLNLHDTMIWSKPNAMPQVDKTRYTQSFEYMFVFSKGKPKTTHIGTILTKYAGKLIKRKNYNIENIDKSRINLTKEYRTDFNIQNFNLGERSFGHPAIFPILLAKKHILSWSNENDIILDPFSGSGTTAVACHNLKRRFICIEKDKDYFNASVERLKNAQAQLKLF